MDCQAPILLTDSGSRIQTCGEFALQNVRCRFSFALSDGVIRFVNGSELLVVLLWAGLL